MLCLVPAMAMAKSKTPARDWKLTVAQQKLEMLGYDVDRKDGRMSKDTRNTGLKRAASWITKPIIKSRGKPLKWKVYPMCAARIL